MTVDLADLAVAYRGRPTSTVELAMADAAVRRFGVGRVVEIGAGPGRHARRFRELGADVVIVDTSIEMLRRAEWPLSIRGDGAALPLRDQIARIVFMSLSLHYGTPESWMDEAARVAEAGGGVMVWTIDPRHHVASFVGRTVPETVVVDEARFPSIERVERAMRRAGFSEIAVGGVSVHRTRNRAAMSDALRSRFVSTLQLVGDDAVEAGIRRLEERYPDPTTLLHYCTRFTWMAATRRR